MSEEELRTLWTTTGNRYQKAVEPIYVPYEHQLELNPYHPKSSGNDYGVRSLLKEDGDGLYVMIDAGGEDWADETREIMSLLKLRLQRDDNGNSYLEDNAIDPAAPSVGTGWRVRKWKMTRTHDSVGSGIFLDEISWRHDDGRETMTLWSWPIYPD